MCHELAKYEIFGTDYLIEIENNNFVLLDVKHLDELYEIGYKQTKSKLKELRLNN